MNTYEYYKRLEMLIQENEPKTEDKCSKSFKFCDDCHLEMELFDGYCYICLKCGASIFTIQSLLSQPSQCRYKKKDYFQTYLNKLQNISLFNIKKYGEQLEKMFPKRQEKYSGVEIKRGLFEHKLSNKLLRYLPEIYYSINEIPENEKIMISGEMKMKILQFYDKVLEIERTDKIKLPNSKFFFAKEFILILLPKYTKTINEIIPEIKNKKLHTKYIDTLKKIKSQYKCI